jgi:uncharacterized protein YcbX
MEERDISSVASAGFLTGARSEPAAAREESEQEHERKQLRSDAENDERSPAVDVPRQPAEVLTEEARDERNGRNTVAMIVSCFITALSRFETVDQVDKTSMALVSRSR